MRCCAPQKIYKPGPPARDARVMLSPAASSAARAVESDMARMIGMRAEAAQSLFAVNAGGVRNGFNGLKKILYDFS